MGKTKIQNMEFILEIFLGRFIIRFLGINTRYFFLKFFNESLKKEDLLGSSKDYGSQFGNDLINAAVGFGVLFLFFYIGNIIYD
jgi:hypothetical protein